MIKRFIYWLKHKHPCKHCCLFCKFYKKCKNDGDEALDRDDSESNNDNENDGD